MPFPQSPTLIIYVAIHGNIHNVISGKSFYSLSGSYCIFAGEDASRALAKMSRDESGVVPDMDDLTKKKLGVLADWEKKFQAKYPVVGTVANN